jgi:hypothetical protein
MKTDKDFLKKIQSAPVTHDRAFKAKLKESLMARAENEYPAQTRSNPWFGILRFSFSMLLLTLIVTQVVIPQGSNATTLSAFIADAKASYSETEGMIYHATMQMESSIYFENEEFTGWKTTSQIEKELWVAPTGDLREEINSIHFDGPNEDGTFDQVDQSDTNIYKIDSYGNGIDYTLLKILGYTTEETAELGEPVDEPIYNVHPGKQNDAEALKTQFENQITCVNKEEGKDFDGFAWASIDKDTQTGQGVTGRGSAHDDKLSIVDGLFKAAEGRLSSAEVIAILEKVQDEPKISTEVQEVDGQNQIVVSLNTADFMMVFSNNKEALVGVVPDENRVTLYFNEETHQLMHMESESIRNGTVQERGSMTVTFSEYLDYESNLALFEPTEDFVAGRLTTRFDQHIEDFEAGCYDQYMKLSDDEAEQWLSILTSQFTEGEWDLWSHPLKVAVGYYKLPGENEIKGKVLKNDTEQNNEEMTEEAVSTKFVDVEGHGLKSNNRVNY